MELQRYLYPPNTKKPLVAVLKYLANNGWDLSFLTDSMTLGTFIIFSFCFLSKRKPFQLLASQLHATIQKGLAPSKMLEISCTFRLPVHWWRHWVPQESTQECIDPQDPYILLGHSLHEFLCFLNLCKLLAVTGNCGNEFHGFIVPCMKMHIQPFASFEPSPNNFIELDWLVRDSRGDIQRMSNRSSR